MRGRAAWYDSAHYDHIIQRRSACYCAAMLLGARSCWISRSACKRRMAIVRVLSTEMTVRGETPANQLTANNCSLDRRERNEGTGSRRFHSLT